MHSKGLIPVMLLLAAVAFAGCASQSQEAPATGLAVAPAVNEAPKAPVAPVIEDNASDAPMLIGTVEQPPALKAECAQDSDCPVAYKACGGGKCVLVPGACDSNADCAPGDTCLMNACMTALDGGDWSGEVS